MYKEWWFYLDLQGALTAPQRLTGQRRTAAVKANVSIYVRKWYVARRVRFRT